MRASLPSALLFSLALAGCAEDATRITGPLVPGDAVHGLVARPLDGGCETTFNPPPLPLPPVHRQVDTGTCQLSHLGRVSLYGEQDINFAAGTQSGVRTFTAANGDVLYAVNAGTSAPGGPGLVNFSTTLTFTGGTGRFEHATGQAHATGTANLIARRTVLTITDGWIAYDASDRSGS